SETSILPSGADAPLTTGATSPCSMSLKVGCTKPTAMRIALSASEISGVPVSLRFPSGGITVITDVLVVVAPPTFTVAVMVVSPGGSPLSLQLQSEPLTVTGPTTAVPVAVTTGGGVPNCTTPVIVWVAPLLGLTAEVMTSAGSAGAGRR